MDETLPAPGGAAKVDALAPGTQAAGRYRIVKFLGAGGMGEVYAAEDLIVGTTVALKTLRPELAASAQAIARFRREIALARKVTDRHVCRLHDVGEHGGRVFLTMELLEGKTLAERLRTDGPLAFPEIEGLAVQLVKGLAALHDAGVVHRDFKSANVILVGDRPVITDFGLARSVEDRDALLTAESGMLGTPAYMAPEQVEGREATPVTDIYSLGIVLFELATGTLPFREDTALATATARLTQNAPLTSSRRAGTPARWNAIIARCLERDPSKRFASVRDVLGDVPRHRSRRWFLAAGGAALLGGAGALWSRLGSIETSARRELVAVLPPVAPAAWSYALAIDLYDTLATSGLPMIAIDGGGIFEDINGSIGILAREADPLAAAWATPGITAVVRPLVFATAERVAIQLVIDRGSEQLTRTFERPSREAALLAGDIAQDLANRFGTDVPRHPLDAPAFSGADYVRYGSALERLYSFDHRPLAALVAERPELHRATVRLAHRLVEVGQQESTQQSVLAHVREAIALLDPVLRADPEHAMALTARAAAARLEYDWTTSEQMLARARKAAPTHARVLWHWNWLLSLQGRFDESAQAFAEYQSYNPRSQGMLVNIAWTHYYARRYHEVIRYAQEIRGQLADEHLPQLHAFEALAYTELAQFKKALEAAKLLETSEDLYWKATLAQIYAPAGMRGEAIRLRDELFANHDFATSAAGWAMGALIDDSLGEIEGALVQLERVVESHNVHALWMKIERYSARLRSEPRFQKLLARVGLA